MSSTKRVSDSLLDIKLITILLYWIMVQWKWLFAKVRGCVLFYSFSLAPCVPNSGEPWPPCCGIVRILIEMPEGPGPQANTSLYVLHSSTAYQVDDRLHYKFNYSTRLWGCWMWLYGFKRFGSWLRIQQRRKQYKRRRGWGYRWQLPGTWPRRDSWEMIFLSH